MKRLTKKLRARLLADCDHPRLACEEVGCVVGPVLVVIDSQAATIRDREARLKVAREHATIDCDHSVTPGDEQRALCDDCQRHADALDFSKPFKRGDK